MNSNAMSLKSKINNYAKANNLSAQVVLQNFMFERFLARLSVSDYKDKFVIKGGMLISALVGLDTRSTMDLDTTIRYLSLSKDTIATATEEIFNINLEDGVKFTIISIKPIREDDEYGGYCIRMNAQFESIEVPLSIDVSTGDIITPKPIEYTFSGIFEDELNITLWGYNIETVLAEKVETVLTRGTFTTRPRDYYDIYILVTTQKYDKNIFIKALEATSIHRGSKEKIANINSILLDISHSEILKKLWEKYQKQYHYAKDISFEDTIKVLNSLLTKM